MNTINNILEGLYLRRVEESDILKNTYSDNKNIKLDLKNVKVAPKSDKLIGYEEYKEYKYEYIVVFNDRESGYYYRLLRSNVKLTDKDESKVRKFYKAYCDKNDFIIIPGLIDTDEPYSKDHKERLIKSGRVDYYKG